MWHIINIKQYGMGKIDVKCNNCGETVQLDDSRTEGFCNYCGSKIVIKDLAKDVPKSENTDSRLANYIALAESAVDGRNGDEALKYANLALEFDAFNADVIELKMKALLLIDLKTGVSKTDEIMACAKRVVDSDATKQTIIYDLFLHMAYQVIDKKLKDVQSFDMEFRDNLDNITMLNQHIDKGEKLHKEALECLKYFYAVPKEAIADNKVFVDEAKEFIKTWNKYAVIAKRAIAPRSTEGNIDQLDKMLARIPESEHAEIISQNSEVVAKDKEYFDAVLKEEAEMANAISSSGSGCSIIVLIGISLTLGAMFLL